MHQPPAGGSLQPDSPMKMAPQLPMMMMMIAQKQQQLAVKPPAQQPTAMKPTALQQQQMAVEPAALQAAVPPVMTAAVSPKTLGALQPLSPQSHSCMVQRPVPAAVASAGRTENDAEAASVAAAAIAVSAGNGCLSYVSGEASTVDSPRIPAAWPAGYVFVMEKNGATGENMVAELSEQALEESTAADQPYCSRLSGATTKRGGSVVPPVCMRSVDAPAAVEVTKKKRQLCADLPARQPPQPIEFKKPSAELSQPPTLDHSDDHVSETAPVLLLPLTLVRPQPSFREMERDSIASPVGTSIMSLTSLDSSKPCQGMAAGAAREAVPVAVSEVIPECSPVEAGAGGMAAVAEGGDPADRMDAAPADGVKAVEVELQVGMRGKGLKEDRRFAGGDMRMRGGACWETRLSK